MLLSGSVVSSFTLKQLVDHSRPESLTNQRIQLIGVVQQVNNTGFFMIDPDDVDNTSLLIYIISKDVEIPTGFESGKTVVVEGKLLSINNIWIFRANMISTKCPSKYN
jgi:cytochrome c-type biogenesis protein CcmE